MKLRFWIQEFKGKYIIYAYRYAKGKKPSEQMYVAARKDKKEIESILLECEQADNWSQIKEIKRKHSMRRKH